MQYPRLTSHYTLFEALLQGSADKHTAWQSLRTLSEGPERAIMLQLCEDMSKHVYLP